MSDRYNEAWLTTLGIALMRAGVLSNRLGALLENRCGGNRHTLIAAICGSAVVPIATGMFAPAWLDAIMFVHACGTLGIMLRTWWKASRVCARMALKRDSSPVTEVWWTNHDKFAAPLPSSFFTANYQYIGVSQPYWYGSWSLSRPLFAWLFRVESAERIVERDVLGMVIPSMNTFSQMGTPESLLNRPDDDLLVRLFGEKAGDPVVTLHFEWNIRPITLERLLHHMVSEDPNPPIRLILPQTQPFFRLPNRVHVEYRESYALLSCDNEHYVMK